MNEIMSDSKLRESLDQALDDYEAQRVFSLDEAMQMAHDMRKDGVRRFRELRKRTSATPMTEEEVEVIIEEVRKERRE